MIRLPLAMTVAEAEAIVGTLSLTEAMPGYSYGLDARRCRAGSELAKIPGSVCSNCYALKGLYIQDWVRSAQHKRHSWIAHPRWVDAMVVLLDHFCRPPKHHFCWFDSGDVQSLEHLRCIVEVCRRTPRVRHWLRTKQHDDLVAFERTGGAYPRNLLVRPSGTRLDQPPDLPPELAHLPTSTVHTIDNPVPGSWTCPATVEGSRGGCDDGTTGRRCRKCWSRSVKNVSYHQH